MKIILIGTSPAMLIEAILLRQQFKNAKIEIHDKKKTPGGSWTTFNFLNNSSVETGSHIFAPVKNRHLYNQCLLILKKKFKIKTYFLKTRPLNIINRNISSYELNKIKYFYVKGGSGALLKSLIKIVKKKRIKILYNSFIEKITSNQKTKKIKTSKGLFNVNQIYVPYYCKLDLDGPKKNISYTLKESIHVLIKFPKNYKIYKKVSYIQKVKFSKLFDRLSNLSPIFNTKNDIFCLRLSEYAKKNYLDSKKILISKIEDDLIDFFKIKSKEKNFSKFKYKFFNYKTSYRNRYQLAKLNKFTKKHRIELVDTSEFIKYMSKNIKRLNAL
tara:strand:- start:5996 stop:6979 length:984 start_codon:yes stop_codon:yes gene_type:complete